MEYKHVVFWTRWVWSLVHDKHDKENSSLGVRLNIKHWYIIHLNMKRVNVQIFIPLIHFILGIIQFPHFDLKHEGHPSQFS